MEERECRICFENDNPEDLISPCLCDGTSKWVDINTKYSEIWPNITKKREADVPQDQEKWRNVEDKIKYLSEKPGKGD